MFSKDLSINCVVSKALFTTILLFTAALALSASGCGGDDRGKGGEKDSGRDVREGPDAGPGVPDAGRGVPDAGPGVPDAGADGGQVGGIGTIQGRVFDASKLVPIKGVKISTAGGKSVTTDGKGNFKLQASAGERVVVLANHADYAKGIEPVKVSADQTSYVELTLAPVTVRGTFDAVKGGKVASSLGASAKFTAKALRTAAGAAVTGNVDVSLTALNVTKPSEMSAFPGDFTATRKDGTQGIMESVVPMDITVRKADEILDLAKDSQMDVTFPIPAGIGAPAKIALWSLDPETGGWNEEGVAERMTDNNGNLVYRAVLGHMSWWNCDAFIGQVTCIRGCVTKNGNPVPNALVKARGVDYRSEGSGYTGSDGCFAEDVKAGAQLSIRAQTADGVSEQVTLVADTKLMRAADNPKACQDIGNIELSIQNLSQATCPAGYDMCNSWCVDLMSDTGNCGKCGAACAGQGSDRGNISNISCVGGECKCKNNETNCNSTCTNTDTDRNNCGKCGTICDTGKECVAGSCKAIVCATDLTLCGNYCVDTDTNNNYCGNCNTVCASGDVGGGGAGGGDRTGLSCVSGKCVCTTAGQTKCGSYCTDLDTDNNNCGSCSNVCDIGTQCTNGDCVAITCGTGETLCGNECANLKTSLTHCGACNQSCYGEDRSDGGSDTNAGACVAGKCVCANSALIDCDPSANTALCVDTDTDELHCGGCDKPCRFAEECISGQCEEITCGGGQVLCGQSCVDPLTDESNCGACGNYCSGALQCVSGACGCPAGQVACLGTTGEDRGAFQCVASSPGCSGAATTCENANGIWTISGTCMTGTCKVIQTDCVFISSCSFFGTFTTNNAADVTYGAYACSVTVNANDMSGTCDSGACTITGTRLTCTGGETACLDGYGGSGCYDLQTDRLNCGSCQYACMDGQNCVNGICENIYCDATPDTPTLCGNDCVDTDTNAAHCGGCDQPCGASQHCTGGSCACDNAALDICYGTCVDLQNDQYNCGECDKACAYEQTCSSGTCECIDANLTVCDGTCVDTDIDPDYCGDCVTACSVDQECVLGACYSNQAPDAVDDAAPVNQYFTVTISVLLNDTDPESGPLYITGVTQPSHGAAVDNGDDTVSYTPDNSYIGDDTFTYTITDDHALTDTATVTVTVSAVDCGDTTSVQALCGAGTYMDCTCASADPCEWAGDGYCDDTCYTYTDHFDDSLDCT